MSVDEEYFIILICLGSSFTFGTFIINDVFLFVLCYTATHDENIIYCLHYDKFPITEGTNPSLVYLSSVMVFSDGFSDTQNKLDPNWSINYLLLQNIVTATEIHNGRKNYFLMLEE